MVSRIRKHFLDHKHNARKRGVKFHFSFDAWFDVWKKSGKLSKRGPYKNQYVMARRGDKGPYAIGNIKIITASQNVKEKKIGAKTREILRNNSVGHTLSAKSRAKIAAARKGSRASAAARLKMASAQLGRKHSPTTKEKMRRSALRIWKARKQ